MMMVFWRHYPPIARSDCLFCSASDEYWDWQIGLGIHDKQEFAGIASTELLETPAINR